MRIDQKTYLILSTLVAGAGLALIYFRHHLYEWLFPLPADFAEGAPPPSSVRFEGTLARALLPFTTELGLLLLFTALAVVAKGTIETAVLGALALCLLGKAVHTFQCTIRNRPFLELTPAGLSYWPGHGHTVFWRWEEIRGVETRREMLQAQEQRWEHEYRFTHLIVHHVSSPPSAEGMPIGFDFLRSEPETTRLVIALPVLGPPRIVAKIFDRYRRQVLAGKRHPVSTAA